MKSKTLRSICASREGVLAICKNEKCKPCVDIGWPKCAVKTSIVPVGTVVCEICGGHFLILGHHLKTHNMSTMEYANKFPESRTISEEYAVRLGESVGASNSKRLWSVSARESARLSMVRNQEDESFKLKVRNGLLRRDLETDFLKKQSERMRVVRRRDNGKHVDLLAKRIKSGDLFWSRTRKYEVVRQNGETVWVMSGLEKRFLLYLDYFGISWQYEKYSFPYEKEDGVHMYTPDFFLPELNLFVEVKPFSETCDFFVLLKANSVPLDFGFEFATDRDMDIFVKDLQERVKTTRLSQDSNGSKRLG